MDYIEIRGDLFSDMKEGVGYAHCIANDGKYGAGIAPIFIDKVFNIRDKVLSSLRSNKWTGEGKAILIPTTYNGKQVYAFNLVTKEITWSKPTYSTVEDALQDLKRLMIYRKIKEIRLPRIGCGLDGLNWSIVSDTIKSVFKDTDIVIKVYVK